MISYLVTGANRGLGLALVADLSSRKDTLVLAAGRKTSSELDKLIGDTNGRVVFVEIEITKPSSVLAAAEVVQKHLGDKGLDVLINNAGVQVVTPEGISAMEDLAETMEVNVKSVHRVTQAFLPLLRKGTEKKVVNITSTMGSIGMAHLFALAPSPGYKISKSTLNIQYSLQFEKEGFVFLPISPGYLETDMCGPAADLPPAVGAAAVVDIVMKADKTYNGKFQNILVQGWENVDSRNRYDGKNPPW